MKVFKLIVLLICISLNSTVYAGETITLFSSGANFYTWNNGVLDNVPFIPLISDTYIQTTANNNQYTDVDSLNDFVILKIDHSLTPDTLICIGDTVPINLIIEENTAPLTCGLDTSAGCMNPNLITVGTQTGSDGNMFSSAPYANPNRNEKRQYLFTAAELLAMGLAGGKIKDIGWEITFLPAASAQIDDFTIKMGCTNINDLTGVFETGLSQVFDPKNIVVNLGWNTHVFDQDFIWDGVSNLLVEICFNKNSTSINPSTPTTNTSFVSSSWAAQFSGTGCDITVGSTGFERPVTRFTNCEIPLDSLDLSFSWSPGIGLSDSTIQNPLAFPDTTTTYIVSIIDANGPTTIDSITISVVPNLNITANTTSSAVCFGDSITLSGNGALNYNWNNGVIDGVSFAPDSTTTYTVSTIGVNGCVSKDSITITVYPESTISANANTINVCVGDPVTLFGSGSSSYSWDNGVIDGISFLPLATTTYSVMAIDNNGCPGTDTITVHVNPGLALIANASATNICDGDSVILFGSGALNYSWDNGVVDSVPFVPIITTTYLLSASDINGCTGTEIITIFVNPNPIVTANASVNNICEGDSVTLTGIGALNYSWDNGIDNGIPFAADTTTLYSLLATDSNGCMATDTLTIHVKQAPPVVANASANNICNGDSVTLTGSGVIDFTWSNGVIDGMPFVPLSTTSYTITSTNSEGCVGTDTITINVNQNPIVNAITSATNICSGDSVILFGSGASIYTWDNGVFDSIPFIPNTTTLYTLSATDTNGCVSADTITITVNQAPIVMANASSNNVCFGDSVVLTGSGAQNYSWNNGVIDGVPFLPDSALNYIVTATNGNGCTGSDTISLSIVPNPIISVDVSNSVVCSGDSVILTGNGASNYSWNNGVFDGIPFVIDTTTLFSVLATDINGCSATDTITVHVLQKAVITAIASDSIVCFGDSIILNGSGALSYSWNNGVIDGVPFAPETTEIYALTATDINGCEVTESIEITVNAQPNVIANATNTNICNGDSITLSGSGAESYIWDNGVINESSFMPLESAVYTVTAVDINGCIGTDTISIILYPNPTVVANASNTILCSGEQVTLIGEGANSYFWNDDIIDGIPFAPSTTTLYTVLGTDTNSCTSTDTITVFVNPNPIVTANAANTNVCKGDEVTLFGSGALNYFWNQGVLDGVPFVVDTTTTFNLSATDIDGCEGTDSITITSNEEPIIEIGSDTLICITETLILDVTTDNSTYLWQDNSTQSFFNVTEPGSYWVSVNNGCVVHSDTLVVEMENCNCNIYIPNSFTPNTDGENDVFLPILNCNLISYRFEIYNREGEKIFTTDNPTIPWDGKSNGINSPIGVYIYMITYQYVGMHIDREYGNILLIR